MEPEELTENEMRDRINELLLSQRIRPHVTVSTTYGMPSSTNIEIEQEEYEEMTNVLRENRS